MSEADLITLLNEDREKLRAELAASHEESRTLAIQLTERQREVAELRTIVNRLQLQLKTALVEADSRSDVTRKLLRILRGEALT